jgi:hypothetical protein
MQNGHSYLNVLSGWVCFIIMHPKCGFIHSLPYTPSWRSAELVKHRDNFTLWENSVHLNNVHLPFCQHKQRLIFWLVPEWKVSGRMSHTACIPLRNIWSRPAIARQENCRHFWDQFRSSLWLNFSEPPHVKISNITDNSEYNGKSCTICKLRPWNL